MRLYNVLFICTANICRTPMAEYYLKHLVTQDSLEARIAVSSAGTWAIDGHPAAPNSLEVCREHGLNASSHRSRMVHASIMNNADLVLCMSTQHKADLAGVFPHLAGRIFTLREYQAPHPQSLSIADPYGMAIEAYRETFRIISREVARVYPFIKKAASINS